VRGFAISSLKVLAGRKQLSAVETVTPVAYLISRPTISAVTSAKAVIAHNCKCRICLPLGNFSRQLIKSFVVSCL